MINMLASLAIWAAVKLGFLWVFVPKGERRGQTHEHVPHAENDPSVVESHDGHVIGAPLRSESQELNRLDSVQICTDRWLGLCFPRYRTFHGGTVMVSPNDGLVHLSSSRSVSETMSVLEGVVRSRGLSVAARIDHAGDAPRAGL